MRQLWDRLGLTGATSVLDVGGTPFNWSLRATQPRLVMLNLAAPTKRPAATTTFVVGDGRYLPFRDRAFDVAYSNSVIEHLGAFTNQRQFADECMRVGRRYYVQTPNRGFPVEPHLMAPFVHWLPRSVQRRLLRNFTVWGWMNRPTPARCEQWLSTTRLLTEDELRQLFPGCEIWHERFLGITKSLMAVAVARQGGEGRQSRVAGI